MCTVSELLGKVRGLASLFGLGPGGMRRIATGAAFTGNILEQKSKGVIIVDLIVPLLSQPCRF